MSLSHRHLSDHDLYHRYIIITVNIMSSLVIIFFSNPFVISIVVYITALNKKQNQIFLIYKEIQKGAVAKLKITNGLLIYQ